MTKEDIINGLKYCRNECAGPECPYWKIPNCIEILHRDVFEVLSWSLKNQLDSATIEPKRIELCKETKEWLDEMDAVNALSNIADICLDWDGYRTANGLGGLINEIWAYARYCADRLAKDDAKKSREPVEPKWYTFNDDITGEEYKIPHCGACGNNVTDATFCPQCGRKVKW